MGTLKNISDFENNFFFINGTEYINKKNNHNYIQKTYFSYHGYSGGEGDPLAGAALLDSPGCLPYRPVGLGDDEAASVPARATVCMCRSLPGLRPEPGPARRLQGDGMWHLGSVQGTNGRAAEM